MPREVIYICETCGRTHKLRFEDDEIPDWFIDCNCGGLADRVPDTSQPPPEEPSHA